MRSPAKLIILSVLSLFCVVGCGTGDDGPTPAAKKWTLMLYLDGDEVSMEQDFLDAFEEMITLNAGSSADVNVVAQFDRYPGTDLRYGGWRITHRFYLAPGTTPTEENAVQDWGDGQGGGREVDMADPAVLTAFIDWATRLYPAKHYVLLIGDHGYGWKGLGIDETSRGRFMYVKELARAIKASGRPIDLLAMDACVMQMIEVAWELKDSGVNLVTGSENLGDSWPLAKIIDALTENPDTDAAALGRAMVDLYNAEHPDDGSITLSTISIAGVDDLVGAAGSLTTSILADDPFTEIQARAQTVMTELDRTVLYAKNGADWSDAGGLSVYFPPLQTGYMPEDFFYYYIEPVTSFSMDASWRDFLYTYYNAINLHYPFSNEVARVRMAMPAFDGENIDLYDFCRRIVEYQE